MQGLTVGCKPCRTLSAKDNNMAIIAAVRKTRLQRCCDTSVCTGRAAKDGAPKDHTDLCVASLGRKPAQHLPASTVSTTAQHATVQAQTAPPTAQMHCNHACQGRSKSPGCPEALCRATVLSLSTALSSEGSHCSMTASSMKDEENSFTAAWGVCSMPGELHLQGRDPWCLKQDAEQAPAAVLPVTHLSGENAVV